MNVQIGSIVIEEPALVKTVVKLVGTAAHDCSRGGFALRQAAKELEQPSWMENLCLVFRLTAKANQLREARRSRRMSLLYFGRYMRLEKCALVVC